MSKNHPIFRSFAAGELSPRMYSRTDSDPWKNGLAKLENAVSASLGPVIRRNGTRYISNSVATVCHSMNFEVSRGVSYFIAITDAPEIVIMDVSDPLLPTVEQRIAATPWDATQVPLIQHDSPPEATALYIVSPEVAPQELVYDGTLGVGSRWSLAAITFVGAPAAWTGTNWPSVIAFFQGRQWLASTADEEQTLWASKSATYKDFTVGALPADGLEFTLAKRGKIEWLAATKNLLAGTVNGEHVITSFGGVIIPNDIQVSQQSSYGSSDNQALLIGNVVVYVSPDGRKLRDVGYVWEENSWQSRDVTFLSEHITGDGQAISQIAWAQHPDNVLWCVTDAGDMVGCTYEKGFDVIGWHKHTTQGTFVSAVAAEALGTSSLCVSVIRQAGDIFFEIMDSVNYLDSSLEVTPVGKTITAAHLANSTVQVTVGGAVHPDVVLDGSGVGTLDFLPDPARPVVAGQPANVVVVGLGFTTQIQTLPLDYTPEEPGTSAHFMKRWNKIFVRVADSAQPKVGKIGMNERPPERDPATAMGLPQPAITQDVQVLSLGWDRFSQVYIEQDLPVALTVTGIFGELTQNVDEN